MKAQTNILVKKFGGTSVGSIERIEAVAERVVQDCAQGQSPVLVISAMAGETNRLVRLANDLNPYYRGVAYDMLLASGEQVSISLLSMVLERKGLRAIPLLAHQVGIKTDSIYSKARIQSVNSNKLKEYVAQGIIPVVAGFQGVNLEDRITTLGRGGTDTTAVAIAASLGCSVCEIYTDVPAIYTADPRLVDKAREIPELCFQEMMEMASLGSKVLHFRCVELAMKFGVKIHLRSTFEVREGTWVVPEGKNNMETPVVSSITHDGATAVFKLFPVPYGAGFLAGLFEKLSLLGVVVDIITQSQNEEGQRLAFSVPEEDIPQVEKLLEEHLKSEVKVVKMKGMAKISTVGVGMKNHPGVAAKFFGVLDQLGVAIHLVTTSDIKISAVIDKVDLEKSARALHTEFSLDRTQ